MMMDRRHGVVRAVVTGVFVAGVGVLLAVGHRAAAGIPQALASSQHPSGHAAHAAAARGPSERSSAGALGGAFIPTAHPIAVHLVIGLLAGAVLFELAGAAARSPSLRDAARWNLVAAAPATTAAVVTGYWEARRTHAHGTYADEIHRLLWYHEYLGYGLLAAVTALVLWRLLRPQAWGVSARLALVVLGLVLVVQGYLGGEMVYRYGNGVQALEAQTPETAGKGATGHDTH